jgi:hypothetical protein
MKEGKVMKPGRKRGYAGGCVFRTRDEAQRHIDELELQGYKGFMVFGLLAKWDRDTRPSKDNWWHDLLVDAEVVVLEPFTDDGDSTTESETAPGKRPTRSR